MFLLFFSSDEYFNIKLLLTMISLTKIFVYTLFFV